MNLGAVLEGRCPTCGAILERRDDCGWCLTCKVGHSATMHNGEGEYRLHMEIQGFEAKTSSGVFKSGPGRVVVTRPVGDTPPTAD